MAEEIQELTEININLNPGIPALPRLEDKTKIDVRYALIAPYAFVHIYWNKEISELIYELEEPLLTQDEKESLEIIERNMREVININVLVEKTQEAEIEYLNKTASLLISELNLKISSESYKKIFYYLYRDFVGLNEIEPLMKDYFIEDIECNGINTPVYIVHRIYRNLKTNIIFKNIEYIEGFVEKLAQRSGRYVSYASPILDGTLPDGSRVNATYTKDVTSKGPTFTIRKFTKIPWTPIQLITLNTLSPEMLAYFWLLLQYKCNILITGGTASGKCVIGETPVYLNDGTRISIKELVEKQFEKKDIKKDQDWEYAEGDSTKIISMNNGMKFEESLINRFWRHKSPEHLYNITTSSGRKVTCTPEHPFFIMNNGKVEKITADKIASKEFIAVPRILPEANGQEFDLIDLMRSEKQVYVCDIFKEVKEIFSILTQKYNIGEEKLAKKLGYKSRTFTSWKDRNAIPILDFEKLLNLANRKIPKNLILKGKTNSSKTKIPKISPDFFRLLALIMADGYLRKNYAELHNSNEKLLNEFIKLSKELFGINSKIEDYKYRVKRVRLYSPVVTKLLNKFIPYGKKSDKIRVPEILFKQNNACIKEFISAIFDCEGYVGKNSLEIGMSNKKFLEDLSILFLRIGIIPRTSERRICISNFSNLQSFNEINLRHEDKKNKFLILLKKQTKHTNVDLVPNCSNLIKEAREEMRISQKKLADSIGVSGRLIGKWENNERFPTLLNFNKFANYVKHLPNPGKDILKIAESDIFWDRVLNVQKIKSKEKYVYDLTVDNHNFLAGEVPMIIHNTTLLNAIAFFIPPEARVVSIEDTQEINLSRENWLPSVARTAIGTGQLGEVDLFSLLRNSFRQNPDYVIVGEVRGKEAFVLFQGMASGHASISTMHADSVDTVIKRLETPPIELSPTLVNTLDAVAIMSHAIVNKQQTRRLREIVEIVKVNPDGIALTNTPFKWNPAEDKFYFKKDSKVFEKIAQRYGLTIQELGKEFEDRAKLIYELVKRKIFDFNQVQAIVNEYYKNPEAVMKKYVEVSS